MKLFKEMFGIDGDMQLGTKGSGDSLRIKIHRAIFQGESSEAKYALGTLIAYRITRRFDLHMQALLDGSPSNQSNYVTCPNGISGTDVINEKRDRLIYRRASPPTTQKKLLSIAFERSAFVAEGICRLITQLLGLWTANAALNLSGKCPQYNSHIKNMTAANFFSRYSWHHHPSFSEVQAWCGGAKGEKKRLKCSYKGSVVAMGTDVVQWGMMRLDGEICEAVFAGFPILREILLQALQEATFDKDICASEAILGKHRMKESNRVFFGERTDHLIFKCLNESFEEKSKGTWESKMVKKRVEKVVFAIQQNKTEKIGGHASNLPITDSVDESVL